MGKAREGCPDVSAQAAGADAAMPRSAMMRRK